MKILIATDASAPQVNGVVRTYEQLDRELHRQGIDVAMLSTDGFRTLPCPTYPEIRLALPDMSRVDRFIAQAKPDAIHIATEGPLGWMVRRWCVARRLPFTTSFHTRFPEYIASRFRLPEAWTYAVLRSFHSKASATMVATQSLERELSERGFRNLVSWTRGVDTALFRPRPQRRFGAAPVFLYAGRVAVEKNIEAFLKLDLPGQKVVVGDGPSLQHLAARYPAVVFTGALMGEALAESYASADVFVFPSRTDTFGMVVLEAMASGVPVAAFPVTGPKDLVTEGVSGFLSHDLRSAALQALALDRRLVREAAIGYSWQAAARLFLSHLRTVRRDHVPLHVSCETIRSLG